MFKEYEKISRATVNVDEVVIDVFGNRKSLK
jgi:hypothetical protein